MIYTYELKRLEGPEGQEYVYRVEDGTNIPIDPANSDYQLYLKSLEDLDGND
jgi:hypothetical protein